MTEHVGLRALLEKAEREVLLAIMLGKDVSALLPNLDALRRAVRDMSTAPLHFRPVTS